MLRSAAVAEAPHSHWQSEIEAMTASSITFPFFRAASTGDDTVVIRDVLARRDGQEVGQATVRRGGAHGVEDQRLRRSGAQVAR